MRIIVKRIDEHLKNIENFNKDLDKTSDKLSEVAVHLNNNDIERGFRFCVFENNVIDDIFRKAI